MSGIVRALIIKDENVLLVRKENTSWYNFPGGKIEPNESKEDALKREVKEELGINILSSRYLGSATFQTNNRKIDTHLYSIKFSGEPWARREIVEILWHPLKDIKKLRLGKSTVSLLYLLSHK